MAQINLTLDQDEILQLLAADRDKAFRTLLERGLNGILKAESAEQLRAEPYERTEERTDSRNGFRERELNTRVGTITLAVPRHRSQPFKTLIFENYSRSEAALILSMAEMVVNGVSTRKVANIMETLCGKSFSKSSVSEACKDLDKAVDEFRNRPITGVYPFLIVDATYFKVRTDGRVISKAMMIALGTNSSGHREVLGFGAYKNESTETWTEFLAGLKARGLTGLKMITSDAHEGIINAVTTIFSGVPWQRCQFHLAKDISGKTPKKYQAGIRSELNAMFNQATAAACRKKRDEIIAEYRDVAPSAMECLDRGFEDAMTVMTLPESMRQAFRTSNSIERLNRELKRRSDVIGIFPNEASLIRLIGSVLMEQNEIYQSKHRIFYSPAYQELLGSEITNQLEETANSQKSQLNR